jgi:ParB-like chromosome segregation protein Spo0J
MGGANVSDGGVMDDVSLSIEYVPVNSLTAYAGNAKLHPSQQVMRIAKSIEEYGNCDPIGVWTNADGAVEVVEGHGRLMALKMLGRETAPVIFLDHLTDEQRRGYALVHNKLTMDSEFDFGALERELASLGDSFDFDDFGFAGAEGAKREPPTEVVDSSGEIDVEEFSEDKFQHVCPRCGFKFNERK